MKNTTWKDNNLLSKFNENESYDRLSDDNLSDGLDNILMSIASHEFASDVRKPIIVVHKIEGVYDNDNSFMPGKYYIVSDGMLLTGIAMYNIPEGKENRDPYDWDFSNGLKGNGWGLLLSAKATDYEKIVPIKGDNLSAAVKYLEKDCTDHYINNNKNWYELLLHSFNPEDFDKLYSDFKKEESRKGILRQWDGTLEVPIEDIEDSIIIAALDIKKKLEEDRLNDKYLIGTPKKTKEYAKKIWIEKGFPCAKRYGFKAYGAKAKDITTPQALRGIEKCLDINIEMIDGLYTLVLGFYSGSDLL